MADLAVTNTFVPSTTISSSQVNTNFSDIVNYINNRNSASASWSALGVTGNATIGGTLGVSGATTLISTLDVTGIATFAAGTTALPGIAFTADPDTGLVRNTTNSFRAVAGASIVAEFTPTIWALYNSGAVTLEYDSGNDYVDIRKKLVPVTNNTYDLGSSSLKWAGIYTTSLIGTTTNDSAATGAVGEIVLSSDTSFGNMAASGTWSDITSISLTAGDWDVYGQPVINHNGATFTGVSAGAVSVNSGTTTTDQVEGSNQMPIFTPTTGNTVAAATISYRLSLSGSTTVYLKAEASYTGGPPQQKGTIWARRAR